MLLQFLFHTLKLEPWYFLRYLFLFNDFVELFFFLLLFRWVNFWDICFCWSWLRHEAYFSSVAHNNIVVLALRLFLRWLVRLALALTFVALYLRFDIRGSCFQVLGWNWAYFLIDYCCLWIQMSLFLMVGLAWEGGFVYFVVSWWGWLLFLPFDFYDVEDALPIFLPNAL